MVEYGFQHLRDVLRVTSLVNIFYRKSPPNFCFPGESHDFWELLYIDKGRLIITAGDRQYLLKSGEIVFHSPGEFHAIDSCENTTANFIVVSFVCKSRYMDYFRHRIMFLTSEERECLYGAIRTAQQVFLPIELSPLLPLRSMTRLKDPPFGAEQRIRLYLEQLLISLYQRKDSKPIQKRVETFMQKKNYKQLTRNVYQYLEDHIADKLTLEQIAKELGYSVAQMKKIFKAETSNSVMDTFIRLKVEEAERLIWEGDLNFTQIAEQLGYDNVQYFSRLFKQRTGMSPTECSRSIGHISAYSR